ncbi:MAG: hypothetical protein ACYSW6_02775 [Planctomycetota bacterium]
MGRLPQCGGQVEFGGILVHKYRIFGKEWYNTNLIVALFNPKEKTLKTIEQIKKEKTHPALEIKYNDEI